jgi:OOP family OmpA-OmpF porin
MKLSWQLMASTAAVALLAGVQSAEAGRFYASVSGGLNFQPDPDSALVSGGTIFGGHLSTQISPNSDTGYVISAAVGAHLDDWIRGLRAEVEGSYRHNKIGGQFNVAGTEHTFPGLASFPVNSTGHLEGSSTSWSVMANAWYDFPVDGKLVPYIGGGIGWAKAKDKLDYIHDTGTNSDAHREADGSGFAWQLGLGVNYEVCDNVSLGVGYRYFRAPNVDDPVFFGKHDAPTNFSNDNHSVALTMTVDFN